MSISLSTPKAERPLPARPRNPPFDVIEGGPHQGPGEVDLDQRGHRRQQLGIGLHQAFGLGTGAGVPSDPSASRPSGPPVGGDAARIPKRGTPLRRPRIRWPGDGAGPGRAGPRGEFPTRVGGGRPGRRPRPPRCSSPGRRSAGGPAALGLDRLEQSQRDAGGLSQLVDGHQILVDGKDGGGRRVVCPAGRAVTPPLASSLMRASSAASRSPDTRRPMVASVKPRRRRLRMRWSRPGGPPVPGHPPLRRGGSSRPLLW